MTASPAPLTIWINGDARAFPAPLPLSTLLAELSLAGKRVAVEVNGDIVPRAEHGTRMLANGDHVEIVHAIGGG